MIIFLQKNLMGEVKKPAYQNKEGTYPDTEPFYDMLWIMSKHQEVPFGEVIELNH